MGGCGLGFRVRYLVRILFYTHRILSTYMGGDTYLKRHVVLAASV